jgi:hypothetical protein
MLTACDTQSTRERESEGAARRTTKERESRGTRLIICGTAESCKAGTVTVCTDAHFVERETQKIMCVINNRLFDYIRTTYCHIEILGITGFLRNDESAKADLQSW